MYLLYENTHMWGGGGRGGEEEERRKEERQLLDTKAASATQQINLFIHSGAFTLSLWPVHGQKLVTPKCSAKDCTAWWPAESNFLQI